MTRPILCACGTVMSIGNGCKITAWESGHERLENLVSQCPDCNVAPRQYHHVGCSLETCCVHPDEFSVDCYKCDAEAMAGLEAELAQCFREKSMFRSAGR